MRKRGIKFILFLLFGGFIIKGLRSVFSRKNRKNIGINFKNFVDEQQDEVEDLVSGKKSIKKFCCDSGSLVKDYFIPYDGNECKPKILRAKSLSVILLVVLMLKAAVTGYLFFIYPNQAIMSEVITKQVLEMINQDRILNDLAPLAVNPALSAAAHAKAEDMVIFDYFAHKSPNGKMPWDWINREEYEYLFVGENLAMNFSSAQSAHSALMQSASHKKNILNKKYLDIGLAVISGEMNGKTTNVLVETFGYRKQPQLAKEEEPAKAIAAATTPLPLNPNKSNIEKEEAINEEENKEEIAPEPTAEPITEEELEEEIKFIPVEETEVAGVTNPKSIGLYTSPNFSIENDEVTEVMAITSQEDENITKAASLVNITHYVLLAILAFVAIALIINILVRVSVQHKGIVLQSLIVIIFIASLVYVRIHFLEQFFDKVTIL